MINLGELKLAEILIKEVQVCDRQIQAVDKEIKDVEEWEMQVTQTFSDMPAGNKRENKLEKLVEKRIERRDYLRFELRPAIEEEKIEKLIKLDEIKSEIYRIPDSTVIEIIMLRHFESQPWQFISAELGYNERTLSRKYKKYVFSEEIKVA